MAAVQEHAPDAVLDGVVVSKMVSGLNEMVVGVSTDEVFGPAVMVGFGGVSVEVTRDVSFRVPPFGRAEAQRMIEQLRGYQLLLPHRGRPGADIAALTDVVMQVQGIVLAAGDRIAEIDLNPVIVSDRGATAVDAMIVLK
jgi:hypothetical protein